LLLFHAYGGVLLLARVDWRHYMFMIPLIVLSVFLMLVILVQRGRGGGLTGALGGMGGQSAFGTKAGDLFTRITIVVAAIWVILSMASLKVLNQHASTGGFDPSQRGAPASKADDRLPGTAIPGGLLPEADKGASPDAAPPATPPSTSATEPAPPTTDDPPAK
jgi:preprotein translocase subunit SecG